MFFQQIKNIFHYIKAMAARAYYGNPSKNITVIGITGTDGKTTTAALIYHILTSCGKKVSMINTVSAVIAGKKYDTGFHVTTPSPFAVQKYLKQAVEHGDEYFILETTSHALDQHRVSGVDFAFGILTNISHEHMHYHRSFERYVEAKIKLLNMSQTAIINSDDTSYPRIKREELRIKNVKTYGIDRSADYYLDIAKKIGKKLEVFNTYNYLAAYALSKEVGLDDSAVFSAMKSFNLPEGRMEIIYDGAFTVIVDFAHTPNALHEALRSIKDHHPRSRLIHIFGAAAFRDDEKRPMMGEESASYADLIIITEEDYRTEDPKHIAKQIAVGISRKGFVRADQLHFGSKPKQYLSIINRRRAIQKALSIVRQGDIIILTGKGHEKSLNRNGKEYPWNDKQEVLRLITNYELRKKIPKS